MLNRYYQQELATLRNLAAEFGRRNPALAPMLGSASTTDPDVERLLEGVAFMTGLVRQRLDDEFPEFIQGIAQLLFPQFLRPLPGMTMMQYSPRTVVGESVTVPAGAQFASIPLDGERATFRAAFDVTVEPVQLAAARWEQAQGHGSARSLVLDFNFDGISAAQWRGERLRLWLGGDQNDGALWLRLLLRHLREVRVGNEGQALTILPASSVVPVGLRPELELLPWPAGAHPAWRILHEYFALPQKLLFIDLTGLERWRERTGSSMRLRFVFDEVPDWAPSAGPEHFVLNVVPAVNLYEQDAHPIRVDNRQPDYRILPQSNGRRSARVFSVDAVHARQPDGSDQQVHPFTAFALGLPTHQVRIRPSALESDYEHFLSLPYRHGHEPQEQTLSVRLTCTDGALPDGLRLGEIREPTDHSPVRVSFANITGVTPYRPAMAQGDLLWRVLAHLNANHLTLADARHLREMLALYLPRGRTDVPGDAAARRRIESIETITTTPQRRIVRGMPVEGTAIEVSCRGDYFAGPGAFFLFGAVLDEFFAGSVALNTFSALTLRDTVSGESLSWPAKIGRFRLL